MGKRDAASEQLSGFKASQRAPSETKVILEKPETLTTSGGAPVGNRLASLTVGPRGPVLLQDTVLLDELAHFDRERIPERVVHAKGAGAHGYFELTHDLSDLTKAAVFQGVGKKTPCFVRFSTVGGEAGSADTARDPRGFAVKLYTEEGNWDLVGNNTPIFFIRDPILFPSFIHTQKRNPATHLKDPDAFWDFLSLRPESIHQVMLLLGDRGTPDGYRHMNGYGSHAFKFLNAQGRATFVKFHFKTQQGIRNLSSAAAAELSGTDPDYATRDLHNAIERGDFPQWELRVQLMSEAEAAAAPFNALDVTKVWPQRDFPLRPVGRLVLNRNPANYFAEVEQAAFAPSHLVPGIEASEDRMLQGRLFSYADTQFHRLGPNHRQIPINCPFRTRPQNTQRDGLMAVGPNGGGAPNYHPNSFHGPVEAPAGPALPSHLSGDVARFNARDEDNFHQAAVFWRTVLDDGAKERLVDNVAGHLKDAADFIQDRQVGNFSRVDRELGRRLRLALDRHRRQPPKVKARM